VFKEEEKTEQRKENIAVGKEYQGRQISKEDGSWKTQREEKSTNGCFGAPRKKEGKIDWRSP
jgi:hypothetical protein